MSFSSPPGYLAVFGDIFEYHSCGRGCSTTGIQCVLNAAKHPHCRTHQSHKNVYVQNVNSAQVETRCYLDKCLFFFKTPSLAQSTIIRIMGSSGTKENDLHKEYLRKEQYIKRQHDWSISCVDKTQNTFYSTFMQLLPILLSHLARISTFLKVSMFKYSMCLFHFLLRKTHTYLKENSIM